MERMERLIGTVVRYFPKIGVAAIRITDGELATGDRIKFKGHTTDFEQDVESMQVEHKVVERAQPGEDVGIKVVERVREGDKIYKITGS